LSKLLAEGEITKDSLIQTLQKQGHQVIQLREDELPAVKKLLGYEDSVTQNTIEIAITLDKFTNPICAYDIPKSCLDRIDKTKPSLLVNSSKRLFMLLHEYVHYLQLEHNLDLAVNNTSDYAAMQKFNNLFAHYGSQIDSNCFSNQEKKLLFVRTLAELEVDKILNSNCGGIVPKHDLFRQATYGKAWRNILPQTL
jgi:hypothetical protein